MEEGNEEGGTRRLASKVARFNRVGPLSSQHDASPACPLQAASSRPHSLLGRQIQLDAPRTVSPHLDAPRTITSHLPCSRQAQAVFHSVKPTPTFDASRENLRWMSIAAAPLAASLNAARQSMTPIAAAAVHHLLLPPPPYHCRQHRIASSTHRIAPPPPRPVRVRSQLEQQSRKRCRPCQRRGHPLLALVHWLQTSTSSSTLHIERLLLKL